MKFRRDTKIYKGITHTNASLRSLLPHNYKMLRSTIPQSRISFFTRYAYRQYTNEFRKKLRIVWGSQTGTAMGFARLLQKEAEHKGIPSELIDAEEYPTENLPQDRDSLICFIQATFGKGEPTGNAQRLFSWLESEKRTQNELKDVQYTVFGLGQSLTYPDRYQAAPKFLDRRLEELGATRTFERGEGDDNADIESDFENWMEKFLEFAEERVKKDIPKPTVPEEVEKDVPVDVPQRGGVTMAPIADKPPGYHLVWTEFDVLVGPRESYIPSRAIDLRNTYPAPISAIRALHHGESSRHFKHVELDISHAEQLSYHTGDYLGIFPQNNPDVVGEYASHLGLDINAKFAISSNDDKSTSKRPPFPTPCTVADYLTHYADLTGPLRKGTLKQLLINSSASEREQLEKLLVNATFQEEISNKHRILLDVLRSIPSLRPSLETLIDIVPVLQPRLYSISSSSILHPTSIHLTIEIVIAHVSTP